MTGFEPLLRSCNLESATKAVSTMSKWAPKLEKKLNGLADSASKESIQTLANWLVFNRKHEVIITKTLSAALIASTTESRQWLYWQVIDEILMMEKQDSEKWERYSTLRAAIGEAIVVPSVEGLGSRAVADKLEPLLKRWDEHNVFGGPSLIGQIRRLLTSAKRLEASDTPAPAATTTDATSAPVNSTSAASEPAPKAAEAPVAAASVATEPAKSKAASPEMKSTDATPARRTSVSSVSSAQRRGSMSSLTNVAQVEYDFESKMVPKGKVDSREFLDPCKAVSTLQIARDVRNDAPVQLSSMLTNLPKDIWETAQQKSGESDELDSATIHDFSMRIPDQLLGLDLGEELQTIKTFQDIIQQQMTAREKLIYLLVKSRCKFGSQEAAERFHSLQEMTTKLKRRRQLLGDAMELEGMDAEIDNTDFESQLKDLTPLSWYDPSSGDIVTGTPNKKQRVE